MPGTWGTVRLSRTPYNGRSCVDEDAGDSLFAVLYEGMVMANKPSNSTKTQEELDKEAEDFLARLTPRQRKQIERMQPGGDHIPGGTPVDIEELMRRIKKLGKKKT